MKNIYILGGGTMNYVRNHLSLCSPAFGQTARMLAKILETETEHNHILKLTKMADPVSDLITNADVSEYVERIIADKESHIVFFNMALCDFHGEILGSDGQPVESGKYADRLKTNNGDEMMRLSVSDKLVSRLRKTRKDIFVVAFKTTTGATPKEQYLSALNLLKANSVNLVLANDVVTRNNLIVVPEEAYYNTSSREEALNTLVKMTMARAKLTFTRSTVIPGDSVPWNSELIPANLRTVVDYCIKKGAYKPFRGSTAGHFAVKIDDAQFVTSKRKVNYNNLNEVGMVLVESQNHSSVIAHGSRPSVGGMSQRIIYKEHPEYDCIVHFHCPPKDSTLGASEFGVRSQQWFECGSHECGKNTSDGLVQFEDGIKAVYLDNHGPNIVFRKDVDPIRVINFIDRNFDLASKTGGLVA